MAKLGNTISMEVSTLGKSTINGVFLVQQAMLGYQGVKLGRQNGMIFTMASPVF